MVAEASIGPIGQAVTQHDVAEILDGVSLERALLGWASDWTSAAYIVASGEKECPECAREA